MPRYFMHLIDGTDAILDPEGSEMPREAVPAAALLAARDCMANDVRTGRLELKYQIEVRDEDDALVYQLAFSDAVEIVPA